MPLDHFSIAVSADKVDPLVSFLVAALAYNGFKEIMRPVPNWVGLGEACKPYLWIGGVVPTDMDQNTVNELFKNQHIAFSAESVEQVQEFHAAALEAGGIDNGKPGPRPEYHPRYYGAFVRDPVCGINFEVCCRTDSDGAVDAG